MNVFLKVLSILVFISLPGIFFVQSSSAAINNKDITQASQIFCDSLKAGKSVPDANEAATDYLASQMNKKDKFNYAIIRQQMRQGIMKICPEQASKVRSAQQN